jgi:alkanesulfonate monooxygenase SsuD/methylene tetrahydromethanopterin reductase-like flavin-dependent oxidoreductase (luciferase family)
MPPKKTRDGAYKRFSNPPQTALRHSDSTIERPAMKFGVFFLSQAPEGVTTPAEALRRELDQMRFAEELGFDSVWLAEHHQSTYCVVPDTITYAAHVAAVTSRIRIGLAVSVLPLRNPLDFAERIAFVDILSNGRLDVGVGRGNSQAEMETYAIDFDERRDRFDEVLDFALRAWTEQHFDFEGKLWKFRDVAILPGPVQLPHPPLYVASSGSPETFSSIARRGLPLLISEAFMTPEKIGDRLETYRALAIEAGHSPDTTERAVANSWIAQKTYIAATTAQARAFAEPYVMWRHRKQLELRVPGASPTIPSKLRKKVPALKSVLNAPQTKDPSELTSDDLVSFELFGTPDDCIARLLEFERAGVRNVILSFSYGGMPDEHVRQSMQLFAREVMPALEQSTVYA